MSDVRRGRPRKRVDPAAFEPRGSALAELLDDEPAPARSEPTPAAPAAAAPAPVPAETVGEERAELESPALEPVSGDTPGLRVVPAAAEPAQTAPVVVESPPRPTEPLVHREPAVQAAPVAVPAEPVAPATVSTPAAAPASPARNIMVSADLAAAIGDARRRFAMTNTELWAAAYLHGRERASERFAPSEWAASPFAPTRKRRAATGTYVQLRLRLTPDQRQLLVDEAAVAGAPNASAYVEEVMWDWLAANGVERPSSPAPAI